MTLFVYSFLCDSEAKDWLNICLAVIGILVSGSGLYVAIRQIIKVKKTSEAVQEEVKSSHLKIRQTFDSNEIGRAVKSLEQAIEYVSMEEFSHALTRMMDINSILENDSVISRFLPRNLQDEYEVRKKRFKEAFKTVSSDVMYPSSIDRRIVQSSLVDIHATLVKVENLIKASVYD